MRILALSKSFWQSVCAFSLKMPLRASDSTTLKMSNFDPKTSWAFVFKSGSIS